MKTKCRQTIIFHFCSWQNNWGTKSIDVVLDRFKFKVQIKLLKNQKPVFPLACSVKVILWITNFPVRCDQHGHVFIRALIYFISTWVGICNQEPHIHLCVILLLICSMLKEDISYRTIIMEDHIKERLGRSLLPDQVDRLLSRSSISYL